MSRKALLSSISIAAAVTLLGAGAYARYSDTETSATATITAGTLDLEVGGAANTHDYSMTNAFPGAKSEGLQGYVLSNTGTLPGVLHVFLVKDADDENSLVEPETDLTDPGLGGEIDSYLTITVDGNSFGYGTVLPGIETAAVGVPVEITAWIWGAPTILIPAGGEYPGAPFELWFGWEISTDATNVIMSDSLGFHLMFTLEQV
ncbi:MAG: TasA family protein [Actinomycetota bacterium]|nr:TasA family protein [Actinomycetota bacterium]